LAYVYLLVQMRNRALKIPQQLNGKLSSSRLKAIREIALVHTIPRATAAAAVSAARITAQAAMRRFAILKMSVSGWWGNIKGGANAAALIQVRCQKLKISLSINLRMTAKALALCKSSQSQCFCCKVISRGITPNLGRPVFLAASGAAWRCWISASDPEIVISICLPVWWLKIRTDAEWSAWRQAWKPSLKF